MNPAGTHLTIARDAFGRVQFLTHFPPRNAATVYPFGAVVLEDGLLYAGDGETAGGVPMPSHFLPRSASVVYPIGSLVYRTDTGRVYRGDGVTAGGILLADATVAATAAVYWGKSASETLDSEGILALSTANKSAASGNYDFVAGAGYAYLAFPASWSSPTSFLVSGFPFGLQDQAPYDTAFGTLTCALVSVSGTSYRVFRSGEILNGSFTVNAS